MNTGKVIYKDYEQYDMLKPLFVYSTFYTFKKSNIACVNIGV